MKLTPAQAKAMATIEAKGILFCYNGVSFATVSVLERLGLITLETEVTYSNPTMSARLGGSKPRPQAEWVAKAI